MGCALKPHSAYEDIGLPWLASVPGHWAMKRGKELFRCIDERSPSGTEELLTVSSPRGVVPRSTANVTMFKAESYVGYKLCWPDDLVINSLWAWAGGLGVSHHHGIVSSAYGVYRLRDVTENLPAFVHELVRSVPFQWELQVRSKGIWTSRLQLTDQSFLEAPFPIPPADEQAAIVRYLDHMDRRIRRYIRAKQQLIKLLEEQRQVIIHQAVTGQIDVRTGKPYPAYKDSGVEWLGQVPEHWEARRMKSLLATRITDGPHTTPVFLDEGVPFLSVDGIQGGELVFDSCRHVSQEDHDEFKKKAAPKRDDILLGKAASTGKIARVKVDFEFSIWSPLALIQPRKRIVSSAFLELALKDLSAQAQVEILCTLNTQKNISMDDIPRIVLPLPWPSEQTDIVHFLDEALANIDAAIARAERGIELLREYRIRLIADVVTGKVDVREAAANLPDEGGEQEPLADEDLLTDESEVDETVEEETALEEVEA